MTQPNLTLLAVQVSAGEDATDDENDRAARQLVGELRHLEVESAELARAGSLPPGAKAIEGLTAGALVVAAVPAVLGKVVECLADWATRRKGRTLKVRVRRGDQEVEIEGATAAELKLLLDSFNSPGQARLPTHLTPPE